MDFPSSVAPFILRGISLLGIDSVMAPNELRKPAWDRLARDLDASNLDRISTLVGLEGALSAAQDIVAGRIRGRVVVDVNR
jgi:acrylyl-CoA reductase (NADPH)